MPQPHFWYFGGIATIIILIYRKMLFIDVESSPDTQKQEFIVKMQQNVVRAMNWRISPFITTFAHLQLMESVFRYLSQSQQARKLIQISGEMYNHFFSRGAVTAVQIDFNFKMLFLRSSFTLGRAHYGQMILSDNAKQSQKL